MHFCNATRTFCFAKCSASHFPLENVQQKVKKQSTAKNKGSAYILLCQMLQMHLMLPLHFVGAKHFPKENVQQSKI